MTVFISITIYMTIGMAVTQACWWLSNKTCDYLEALTND